MGGCLDPYDNTAPSIFCGYPKRDHKFDNHPNSSFHYPNISHITLKQSVLEFLGLGFGV